MPGRALKSFAPRNGFTVGGERSPRSACLGPSRCPLARSALLLAAHARRPRAAIAALYGVGGLLEIAGASGALGEARAETAWILGASIPFVRTPATALGLVVALVTAAAALFALAILGGAFLRGRRE